MFIWVADKNPFALATMKNSHNNQLYLSVATKNKKHIGAKRYLRTRMTFSHSLTVYVGVSKFDYTDSILLDVDPRLAEHQKKTLEGLIPYHTFRAFA